MGLKTCFGTVLQMKVFAKRVSLADPNIDCEVINWQSSHSLCRTTWDWLKPLFVLVGPTCWDNSGNGGWVFSQIKVTETVEQKKKHDWTWVTQYEHFLGDVNSVLSFQSFLFFFPQYFPLNCFSSQISSDPPQKRLHRFNIRIWLVLFVFFLSQICCFVEVARKIWMLSVCTQRNTVLWTI